MNKTFLAIAGACMLIAILSPIVVYVYFNNIVDSYKVQIEGYKSEIESYKLQILNSMQENEVLRERTIEYMKPYDPYLKEPYLVTELGWYLHDSLDLFPESRNKLTIYGKVTNIGAKTANNCTLIVNFYINSTVIQTSEIKIGAIRYWSFSNINKNIIDCPLADSVTKIEVERTWANQP